MNYLKRRYEVFFLLNNIEPIETTFVIYSHSFGGVIASYLPLLESCRNIKISHIVLMASPFKLPLFSISYHTIQMQNLYKYFYYNAYHNTSSNYKSIYIILLEMTFPFLTYYIMNKVLPLLPKEEIFTKIENISFVSFVSDYKDVYINTIYAELQPIIPESHGKTVYISNIKNIRGYPLITGICIS